MLRFITAAALGLAALVAVPAAAGAQTVERQTTVVERGRHGGERVVTRTTVRRSSFRQRRAYGRPGYARPGYARGRYGRPGYARPAYGRPASYGYGRQGYRGGSSGYRHHCWNGWYHGRPVRRCR